jgi:hypothetical protein
VKVRAWCEDLGGTKYITNNQVRGGYSLIKNETFSVNLGRYTWQKEV